MNTKGHELHRTSKLDHAFTNLKLLFYSPTAQPDQKKKKNTLGTKKWTEKCDVTHTNELAIIHLIYCLRRDGLVKYGLFYV